MKRLRAGLNGDVDLSARAESGIGFRVRGRDLEFLDSVDRRQHFHAASASAVVILLTVDAPDVVVAPHAVERDARRAARADACGRVEAEVVGRGGARNECRQLHEVAAVHGDVLNLPTGNDFFHGRALGLQLHGGIGDLDRLGHLAQFECHVDDRAVADVQDEAAAAERLESARLDLDRVGADFKGRRRVRADLVGRDVRHGTGLLAGDRDFGTRDHRPGRIGDDAGNGGGVLRAGLIGGTDEQRKACKEGRE